MSEPTPIAVTTVQRPAPDVRGAIARAAAATGTDFSYLMAQARLESGLNPHARAATSSAAGLYQFTGQTWLSMLDKHGAELGIGGAGDPAARSQLLALRSDPELSALMAGTLANDNRDFLSGILGRDPDASELYLAHFLGAEGAGRFLGALGSNPAQSAAALLPRAAAANRGIFFGPSGARSVGEVMDLLRGRMTSAMNAPDAPLPTYAAAAPQGGPIQQAFNAAANAPDAPPARSMADTLRDAFALAQPGAAPAHVRAAYGQLRSLGI
ncbi:lytic transglycosylase domain-containing protein [Novosphingobium fuchskuhlense]|uniref:lytic transglycosylase domain-containing protein n=1 Tax=Novosphingobium fuchskuhlense TaxID=1117702 RepID=UPI000ABB4EB7|nr:lytic transglycosylase domain-containing protein [Novosphingobium fuchskuhlense]